MSVEAGSKVKQRVIHGGMAEEKEVPPCLLSSSEEGAVLTVVVCQFNREKTNFRDVELEDAPRRDSNLPVRCCFRPKKQPKI